MKNLYLREGGYWFSNTVKKKRVWINLHTKDLSEAVKKVEELRRNPLSNPGPSFKDHIEEFVTYKLRLNLFSRHSASTKRQSLLIFCRWIGEDACPSKISSQQIERYYQSLQKTVTEATAQSYLMALRSFFRWTIEVKRVRLDNPVKAVKLARCDRAARKEWCNKELKEKLIRETPNDELRFILFCGFDAGLRRNEIVEARRDWFDLSAGLLHVRKADRPPRLREGELSFLIKDRDERTIPLTAAFKTFLSSFLKDRQPLDFAIHPDVKHGCWRYRYDFRRPFSDYMQSQGVAWVTPHIMRHSFASILASAGVSIFKISEWLGDRVDVVQRHYAKLAPGDRDIETLSSPLQSATHSTGS